ncbi:MAG TPA: hypothetical protein VKV04_08355, partial [Verrucomicrobiae bacterium]|nr:hypothetical protein [Verrucomicrobiae bacterium]
MGITGFLLGRISVQPNIAAPSLPEAAVSQTQLHSALAAENLSSDKNIAAQSTSAISPEQAWQKLTADAATPARNAALADALEKIAATD